MVIIFLLVVFMLAQYFLGVALSGRDEALDRLSRQVSELASLLSLERQANAEQRLDIAQLSAELQTSTATRDSLSSRLTTAVSERDALELRLADMTDQAARAAADAEAIRAALAESDQTIATDRETLELKLAELASLRRDIATLRLVRAELEVQVSQLAVALDETTLTLEERSLKVNLTTAQLAVERDRAMALEARLADQTERTVLAQKEIEDREIRLDELRLALRQSDEELLSQRALSSDAQARVELLNQQIVALRQQLARLADALDIAETEAQAQGAVIADLGRKLNLALASKVEELQRYRSDFFGRLREVLGKQPGIRIVDDRFVFQSEVLFGSGSATLEAAGRGQMAQLAQTLLTIAEGIPPDIPWILRVDGHTDRVPIATSQFASNWELSSARAISVVRFLVSQGVPPDRLVAAGFGEFQPIDPSADEIALRRNRRIELKLTSR
ncbi:MAG: peptidoglycan -binding protein [Pseudomonadota bacterium]|nr:peptidoglycan -binding protein [Pseudomonadota bacterium]